MRRPILFILSFLSLGISAYSSATDNLDETYENRAQRPTVVLQANRSFASQVTRPNVIYVVNTKFDLKGETIRLAEGVLLRFEGGIIKNGTLVGKNTSIGCLFSEQIFSNVYFSGEFETDEILPEWFGAKGDGKSDDFDAIQSAINFADVNTNNTVRLLSKVYKITKPLLINNTLVFKGTTVNAWNYGKGTQLLIEGENGLCIKDAKYVRLESVKLIGNNHNVGVSVSEKAYGFNAERVFVSSCRIGFHIQDSWNYRFEQCRVEGAQTGFKFEIGTASTIESCVAYNCTEFGFYLKNVAYSSLVSCGSDGSKIAYYLGTSCRGVTLTSCGAEKTKAKGAMVVCEGTGCFVDISAFYAGLSQKGIECDIFRFSSSAYVTLTNCFLGSSIAPNKGHMINVNNAQVFFINCQVEHVKNVGDIDKCIIK